MAEFLTTSGISFHIEKIIVEASNNLTLVSPFLRLSELLQQRLADASDRGVAIHVAYGKNELQPNEMRLMHQLGCNLYFLKNLHAKCYFNDRVMIIASMNIYEFSEKNNREMGLLIDRKHDASIYDSAQNEVQSILKHAKRADTIKGDAQIAVKKGGRRKMNSLPDDGFCIRCTDPIQLDPAKPYCLSCYTVWSIYGNVNYTESVCHSCGKPNESSMDRPLCLNCYKKLQSLRPFNL